MGILFRLIFALFTETLTTISGAWGPWVIPQNEVENTQHQNQWQNKMTQMIG
jgi:hypothetical protein